MTKRKLISVELLIAVLAAFIMVPGVARAEQFAQTTLYLNFLPYRLTEKSGRQYDLLLKELFEDGDTEVSRKAVPLARGKALFLHDRDACLFPTNILALRVQKNKHKLIVSNTVDIVSLRLYTPKTTPSLSSVTDYDPGRIGFISGSGAIQSLPQSDQFVAIPSEKQLITMLELGRLDAFLGHHPDTVLALEQLGKPDALTVSPITVNNFRFPITFICHDNPVGRRFIKEINVRIAEVYKSGRMKEILGPHAELPEQDQDEEEKQSDMIR